MTKTLTETEVWDKLHEALAIFGDARGATTFADASLETARRALFSLQIANIYKTDGLVPSQNPEHRAVELRVILPTEAIDALKAYALDQPETRSMQETVAAILGEHLARSGHFDPKSMKR